MVNARARGAGQIRNFPMPKKTVKKEPVKEKVVTLKEGMKMIQFLQKQVGITESDEKAKAGWNSMTDSEKATTLRVYKMFQ